MAKAKKSKNKKSAKKTTKSKAVKKSVKKATKTKKSAKSSKAVKAKATKVAKKTLKKAAAPAKAKAVKPTEQPAIVVASATKKQSMDVPSKGPKIGEVVPDFSLDSTAGGQFNLKNYRGKKVVLYFYPKDATPGCTLEGLEFSSVIQNFKDKNTEIFGISRDSMMSHDKFKENQGFKFDLLSDPDEKACKIFDVIHEKNMYGKMVMGVVRSTFLIDEQGRLQSEWRKVKAEGHAKEVLETI